MTARSAWAAALVLGGLATSGALAALGALDARLAAAEPPPPSERAVPPCVDDERLDRADAPAGRVATKDYLGKTPAALIARFGEPGCKSPTRWRYWRPEGCAYEKDVITLRFERGKVRRVHAVRIITGQECLSVE